MEKSDYSSTNDLEIENNVEDFKQTLLYKRLNELFTDYMLSEIQCLAAFKFIKDKFMNNNSKDCENLKKWILMKINHKSIPEVYDKMQLGCPDLVPGLRIKNFWEPEEFPWVQELIKNFDVIQNELLILRNGKGFQPYKSPKYASDIETEDKLGSYAHDKGSWNVFYLFLHDLKFEENCKKCPKTVEIIQKLVPRQYFHAFFSAVTPETHIIAHNGPTNRKLRLHFPLLNVEGSKLRAGSETKHFKLGEPIIFDDSFNHESWHNGDKTRINLILDFWHPDLSDAEVKFFKMLQHARLRNGRKYLELLGKGADDDNYFEIIEKSKDILKNNDWWVG